MQNRQRLAMRWGGAQERNSELIRRFLVQVLGWMVVLLTKGGRPGVEETQEMVPGGEWVVFSHWWAISGEVPARALGLGVDTTAEQSGV